MKSSVIVFDRNSNPKERLHRMIMILEFGGTVSESNLKEAEQEAAYESNDLLTV